MERSLDTTMLRSIITLALVTASAIVASAQGMISGRVVNSVTGAPVRRAEVNIYVDGQTDLRGTAPTDADGRFVCRSLPAGRYRLGAQKKGYAPMEYGATRPYMAGYAIALAAGERKTDIVVQLPQLAVLTGTVLDVDGEPAHGVGVQALHHEFQRGKAVWTQAGWAYTDSNGRYRLFHMLPGKYLVTAKYFEPPRAAPQDEDAATGRLVYATTYFPGALDPRQARILALGPGETLEDIDIRLLQSRPIVLDVQGDITAPVAGPAAEEGHAEIGKPTIGSPASFVQLSLMERNSSTPSGTQLGGGFPIGSRYVFKDLLPGRYVLSGEVTLDGRLYAAREELDLSGGSLSLTLKFAPAVDLAGHVRIEDGSMGVAGGRVFLVAGDGSNRQGAEALVQPNGSYVLKSVPPGLWDIGFEPIPKSGYLKSMMLGDLDVLRADMSVTAETKASLEIVVSAGGAQLSGRVKGGTARAVLAAPQGDLASALSFYGLANVDENGAFEMKGMRPGEYRVYAFEDLAYGAWFDPDFLKPYEERGTLIELKAGAKPQVAPQVIGAEAAR